MDKISHVLLEHAKPNTDEGLKNNPKPLGVTSESGHPNKILTSSSSAEDGLVGANLNNSVARNGARNDDDLGSIVGEGGGQRCEGRDLDGCSSDTTFGSVSIKM